MEEVEPSAGAATNAATKGTPQGLSLGGRIKVIEARQMGKSMRQLAAQFNCGKTQILNTLAQKERYVHEWELLGGRNNPSIGARKRFRHTRNEQINRSVHEWYQQQTSAGVRITGPMLQRQARQFAGHLQIANFAASNGWLANFRRYYNIVSCYCSIHHHQVDLFCIFTYLALILMHVLRTKRKCTKTSYQLSESRIEIGGGGEKF